MATAALAYEEPDIVTILVQSSFLLLLNIVNWIFDNAVYCGLVGQVLVGMAWGTPGATWLPLRVQETIAELGYLGLILIVYEGGLSTKFSTLWSNLYLSGFVALIGVCTPIALSFTLLRLCNATPVQAFAAGAALCSTSLGTTFTILGTSGLDNSRLGVILSSAAMLDDVAGLVMVQIISNLGVSDEVAFKSTTVIRPVFVSIAFAIVVPLSCRLVVQPLARKILASKSEDGKIWALAQTPAAAFTLQTLILIALVTGSSYAGTSNLFAAYISGAVITWWNSMTSKVIEESKIEISITNRNKTKRRRAETTAVKPSSVAIADSTQSVQNMSTRSENNLSQPEESCDAMSGVAVYERFYDPAVKSILKPFFFASIGFSIPITQMFHGAILWRGLVYTTLMIMGKLACGLVLVRFSFPPTLSTVFKNLSGKTGRGLRRDTPVELKSGERESKQPPYGSNIAESSGTPSDNSQSMDDSADSPANTARKRKQAPSKIPKPQSLYPAAMLGSAMVARGEIGFLISSLAESRGVFGSGSESTGGSSEIFLVATWAVLLCTIIGPISMGVMVKRVRRLQKQERGDATGRPDPLGIWGLM